MFTDLYLYSIDPTIHISLRYIAQVLVPLCWCGAAGVIVFFFTSGYVITHVLQSEPPVEFLIKRIFRIYPLFMFAVLSEIAVNTLVDGAPIPTISQLVPHLLLLGDVFGVPTSLSGVEWTLRVEVAFYVVMAILKAAGLVRNSKYLPGVFAAMATALYFLPPYPNWPGLAFGYTTLYAPLLFLGACIYLLETGKANANACTAAIILIAFEFWNATMKIQPDFINHNHSMYAFILFFAAWMMRTKMKDGPLIRLASNLTYSVYLFHNWAWPYLLKVVTAIGITTIHANVQIVILILAICYFMHRTVEHYGLRLGKLAIKHYRAHRSGQTKTKVPAEIA